MGLDITIKIKRPVICPKCGEVVAHTNFDTEDSDGRIWYEILDKIGYKNDDWYAKDMQLTKEQAREVFDFVTQHIFDVYNAKSIRAMMSAAMLDGDEIVINADW